MSKNKFLYFEDAVSELEKIADILEDNSIPLHEAIVHYQRSQEIIRECEEMLDRARDVLQRDL